MLLLFSFWSFCSGSTEREIVSRVGNMKLLSMFKVISRSARPRTLSTKATESTTASQPGMKSSSTGSGGPNIAAVPGVTSKVMSIPNSEVGPGASKSSSYKNPEYYCYNPFSYAEAEVEMFKFRLPQPSNKASK
ncbi:NADH dehydrogenase [ubiquinone] flavoprotein 3, mitochondrial-like [Hetaerina americana]|uniref:NADH dehydrogenase [ubiquinone] flavoprotein 3, mitochondrial-like n=1 Tax=Hetaerina americana TaxID=62018 RepID=UPI003A7F350A